MPQQLAIDRLVHPALPARAFKERQRVVHRVGLGRQCDAPLAMHILDPLALSAAQQPAGEHIDGVQRKDDQTRLVRATVAQVLQRRQQGVRDCRILGCVEQEVVEHARADEDSKWPQSCCEPVADALKMKGERLRPRVGVIANRGHG